MHSHNVVSALIMACGLVAVDAGASLCVSFEKIADQSTPIPGGVGAFTSFEGKPAISNGEAVFLGYGSGGQSGVYLWSGGVLTRIADETTVVPDDGGTFTFFQAPCIGDGYVAFLGGSSSGNTGIYLLDGAVLERIADQNTIAQQSGGVEFLLFSEPAVSEQGAVTFWGSWVGGGFGVYRKQTFDGQPFYISGSITPIPSGSGTFEDPWGAPDISQSGSVAFQGRKDFFTPAVQFGVYRGASMIANRNVQAPDGSGLFEGFDSGGVTSDSNEVAFKALTQSTTGIYRGQSTAGLALIANQNTVVPGRGVTFGSFGIPSISDGNVGFLGYYTQGSVQRGVYLQQGAEIFEIISTQDTLEGKDITSLFTGRFLLDDDQLAFFVSFAGGTSGLYAATVGPSETILFVDDDAAPGGSGGCWGNAFDDLQDALAVASATPTSVEEIWIASGTYTPTTGTNRSISFPMPTGVAIYGGFAGGETSRDQRDPSANPTILSGEIGDPDDVDDNSFHVLTAGVGTTNAVLDGLIIERGNANGTPQDQTIFGGGIFNNGGSMLVNDCVLRNNAGATGGAVYASGAGAMVLTRCIIENNTANAAAGVFANIASLDIHNCRLSFNYAGAAHGGAMLLGGSSSILFRITNTLFERNRATTGGAINLTSGEMQVVNCGFVGNVADTAAGAIRATGAFASGSIRNSIFRGNTGSNGSPDNANFWIDPGTMTVSYCNVEGWSGTLGGVGNFDADPQFVDAIGPDMQPWTGDEDYRLGPGSPCIDAADNTVVPADAHDLDMDLDIAERIPLDLDGAARFVDAINYPDAGVPDGVNPIIDIGPYEAGASTPVPQPGDADGDGDVDIADLNQVIGNFGQMVPPGTNGDVTGDGIVDINDLNAVIGNFGAGVP